MNINTILTELVDIANTLDKREFTDIGADLDAAIFILSSEDAQPINKSLASLVKEQFASLSVADLTTEELEHAAVVSAENIWMLFDKVLKLDPKVTVAILNSLVQSIKSVLEPGNTLSTESIRSGTDLLAEAERKLACND